MVPKRSSKGFTLVELMIVVAIVGVLAAMAIYGVRRYILNSKTAEARNSIGQMSKDASAAFNREGMAADILTLGTATGITNRLCAPAQKTVPENDIDIKGKKYQSKPSEWAAGTQVEGWQCVKFSMQDPQYYKYIYTSVGTKGEDGETFTAEAKGDLDGNGTLSSFVLGGKIQKDGNALVVTIAPNIKEANPEE